MVGINGFQPDGYVQMVQRWFVGGDRRPIVAVSVVVAVRIGDDGGVVVGQVGNVFRGGGIGFGFVGMGRRVWCCVRGLRHGCSGQDSGDNGVRVASAQQFLFETEVSLLLDVRRRRGVGLGLARRGEGWWQ